MHETGTNGDGPASKSKSKKKKAHRGYAFVVYEREKDMKGIISPNTETRMFLQVCISG